MPRCYSLTGSRPCAHSRRRKGGVRFFDLADSSDTVVELRTRLAEVEARLAGILSGSVDALIVADERGRIETFSAAAERLFGWPAGDMRGQNLSVLMPEPDRSGHEGYMDRYAHTGERRIIGIGRQVSGLRRDGSVFPMDLSVGEMRISGRRLYIGIVRDVSDRLRIEEALRLREEQFRRSFYGAPIGCLTMAASGRITSCNAAFAALIGLPADEVPGGDLQSFLPALELPLFEDTLARVVSGDEVDCLLDRRCVRADGRILNVTLHLARIDATDQGCMIICQVLDHTDQMQAEAAVQDLRERLKHMDRLTTLGEMASGIAHEINQPLTAIAAYAQAARRMLDADATPHEDLAEACRQVAAQAQRAGEVIRRLRGFVKKGEVSKEYTDLAELLRSVLTLAELDARHHDFRIDTDVEADLPPVVADGVQVQQVILNLIRNGIDAMEDARTAGKRAHRLTLGARRASASEVEISVADQGTGVSGEMERALFTPFATTKRSGMGLGLSISASIVTAHGGRLWHTPNPGGGALFAFTLPVAPGC